MNRADAANPPQRLQPGCRQQVMPPGDQSLHDHIRRILQQRRRFISQALTEQQHRTEQEHQQGINQQQTEVAGLAAQQSGKGIVDQIFLAFEEGGHKR